MSTDIYINSYKFPVNPTSISSLMTADRSIAVVETYDSVAVFSWGMKLAGKQVEFKWDFMPSLMYDSLFAIYTLDQTATLTANAVVKNVELMSLTGTYLNFLSSHEDVIRKDVSLTILFLG